MSTADTLELSVKPIVSIRRSDGGPVSRIRIAREFWLVHSITVQAAVALLPHLF
jgi:hypothetical protein